MAKKNLATAQTVQSMLRSNCVFIEVDGAVRRISLDNLMNAINEGNEELLREVAWGVPLKQATQSSPAWGRVGNLDMWAQYKALTGRYLVKNNGKAAKLSVSNSGVYADGTTLDESIGHVMVHAPRLYYLVKIDAVTNIPTLWMSMLPIGGHYIEAITLGAYLGSVQSSALVSRSGVVPTGNKTINQFWTAAQVNGAKWGLISYDHVRWMMMMALSEYGNPNIQAMLGNGITGSNNSSDYLTPLSWAVGETKSLGDGFGKVDKSWTTSGGTAVQNACHVSVLGIEDPYALMWQMIQGIYCGNSGNTDQAGNEVFIYQGNRMPSAAELAAHPAGDYRELTRLTSEGYISRETLGEFFDLIPSSLSGGGSTSYWCDYFWGNSTGQLVLLGGTAYRGARCGLAYLDSYYAFSDSDASVGSRLAYYGEIEIINGHDMATA